ncbi:Cyclic nucleotide-binding domain-containing protein [Ruminococcaceae bacterium YAD3003]|nr:Cyclic nucleotide-binding domain-containing protein [Ruminococcaceae bacterium YAD3003]
MGLAEKKFKNGEIIVKEGDVGTSFFKIVSGSALVYAGFENTDPLKIAVLNKGEYFGEMAIIESYPRNATVIAKGEVSVVEISEKEMYEYFRENPEEIIVIMKHLGSRIQAMETDYEDAQRLLKELQEADAAKKKSFFSRIKKHVDKYQSNKDSDITVPNADPLRETLKGTADEGFGDIELYDKGSVIYEEGDHSNSMYILHVGTVGMYKNYGKADEAKVDEAVEVSFFGEMGMIADEPRKVTAVAEVDETYVEVIDPDNLEAIFQSCPIKIIMILRYLSYRLRKLDYDFIAICKRITETYG